MTARPTRVGVSSTTWRATCKECPWQSGNTSQRSQAQKRADQHNRDRHPDE